MPWDVVEHEGMFCLQKKGTTTIVKGSCHADKADTMAMMRAMYANVPDAEKKSEENSMDTMNDLLTFDGGEIKAMGDGKLLGLGVYFSGPNDPDRTGEFFSAETDYDLADKKSVRLLWEHNLDRNLKGELTRATFEVTDKGIVFGAQLDTAKREHRALYSAVERGELGFSSGSSAHLVERIPVGKSTWLKSWPIIELSLTKKPTEPRAIVMAVKALQPTSIEDVIKSFEQEGTDAKFDLAGTPAIARFCEAVAPNSFKGGSQRSEAAADAIKEFITIGRIMGEAFFSDHSRLVRRGEHRFVKSNREIDAATLEQARAYVKDIEEVVGAFEGIKSALSNILRVSEMGLTQQKALDEQARFELWNFGRITGKTPEELQNG